MRWEKNRLLLAVSTGSFFLVAVSLTLMAFDDNEAGNGVSRLGLVCGLGFWIFLVIGILTQIVLSLKIKSWRRTKGGGKGPRVGIFAFFRNLPGKISDVAFLVSLALLAIFWYLTNGTGLMCYISCSLMFFSFCSHCIFNGKNYFYITNWNSFEGKRN